jgi:ABC-2 type transport system ATP-binding protein
LDGRDPPVPHHREERDIATRSTPPPGPVRVEVRGLSKSFGAVKAVSDLSFTVEPGTVTGFLGPNGAGKTTTLRMMLGLGTPDAGTATFDGKPYVALAQPLRTVGAVLETAFHPARTGRNHLRVYCRAAGFPVARADEVLMQVGLAEAGRRRAGGYSLGMRQRLALATALLGDPAVLVLDEPANGLDPEGIQWLRGFLRHLAHEQGRTILVSSHLLSEVEQMCTHIGVMHVGALVAQGTTAELRAGTQPSAVVETDQPREAARIMRELGMREVHHAAGSATGLLGGIAPEKIVAACVHEGVPVVGFRVQSPSLEDVFVSLTGEGFDVGE